MENNNNQVLPIVNTQNKKTESSINKPEKNLKLNDIQSVVPKSKVLEIPERIHNFEQSPKAMKTPPLRARTKDLEKSFPEIDDLLFSESVTKELDLPLLNFSFYK